MLSRSPTASTNSPPATGDTLLMSDAAPAWRAAGAHPKASKTAPARRIRFPTDQMREETAGLGAAGFLSSAVQSSPGFTNRLVSSLYCLS